MIQAPRLFLVFCLLIIPFVYSPTLLDYFHHSRFLFSSFGLALFCAFLLIEIKKLKKTNFSLLDGLLFLFITLNFLSILWAPQWSEAVFYAQKWLILGSVFLLMKWVLMGNRASQVLFIGQLGALSSLVISSIVSYKLIGMLFEAGLSNKALYDLKVLFGHKSLISTYLTLLIPISLLGHWQRSKRQQVGIYALIVWQLLIILLLQSRAMYLAALATFCLLLYYAVRHQSLGLQITRKTIAITGIFFIGIVGVFLALAGPDLRNRLNPALYFESQTSGERRFVWYKTQGLLHDHPILGVGAGNWKIQFPRYGVEGAYRLQDQDVIFTRAHNDFLEIWSELGPLGMLIYSGIFLLVLYKLLYRPNRKDVWQHYLLAAGLTTFMISSFLDFPKERIAFLILFGIYLGLCDRVIDLPSFKLSRPTLRMILIVMVMGLTFNTYIGLHRYNGEVNLRKLFNARAAQRWTEVVSLAKESSNSWHLLDPSAVPISFYEGIALYSLSEGDRALDAFQSAYAINPFNFHVVNNIATVLVSQGHYEPALNHLYEALSINPRFEEAIFNLAFCLNALGRNEEALLQIQLLPHESEKKQVFLKELGKFRDE